MAEVKQDQASLPAKSPKQYGKVVITLENCLLPPERLQSTPSSIDGLDPETEMDLRILGCELIQTAGILLRLPQVVCYTRSISLSCLLFFPAVTDKRCTRIFTGGNGYRASAVPSLLP